MTTFAERWPSARLGRVARLRVVAAGLPGAHLHERVINADFDEVWRVVSDLERTTPLCEPDVQSLQVLARNDDRWQVRVRLPRWAASRSLHLDVTMRTGWCWMTSRPGFYVIGIAAEPAPGQPGATLLAHLEGVTLPHPPAAGWLVAPLLALSRWRHRLHVPRDAARLAAAIERP